MNDLLGSALRLYCKVFGVILGLVLSIGLVGQMLSSYLAYNVFDRKNFVAGLQTGLLIDLVFGSVIAAGVLHALFVDRMGRRAGFLECFGVAVSHWLQLCWTNLLTNCLVVMVSALFFLPIGTWQMRLIFLLPSVVIGIRLSLAVTVVMTEGEWGVAALRRSAKLTTDRGWQILGLCLFVYVPVQLAGFIGIGMLQTNPQFDTWQMTAGFGTVLKLASSFIPVCFFCLYEKIIAEDRPEE
ncbi:MAG: hypothetical protein ABIT76_01595 [Chthoniobacterales bacterium]